eukprot:scaffold3875_cov123-Cylindrotheca_fusiformis.AAC.9
MGETDFRIKDVMHGAQPIVEYSNQSPNTSRTYLLALCLMHFSSPFHLECALSCLLTSSTLVWSLTRALSLLPVANQENIDRTLCISKIFVASAAID